MSLNANYSLYISGESYAPWYFIWYFGKPKCVSTEIQGKLFPPNPNFAWKMQMSSFSSTNFTLLVFWPFRNVAKEEKIQKVSRGQRIRTFRIRISSYELNKQILISWILLWDEVILSLSCSPTICSPYLKEASAPVQRAEGRTAGWLAEVHTGFLVNAQAWHVFITDTVGRGRSFVGQKHTHFPLPESSHFG